MTPAANQGAAQEEEDAQTIQDFCDFLAQRHGYVIRAWRRSLDPNTDGQLLFAEFLEALARVQWHGDTSALWTALQRRAIANTGEQALGLREFSPVDAAAVEQFRSWAVEKFGGAIEMFRELTGNRPCASLNFERFREACNTIGFPGDAWKVFNEALDLDGSDSISLQDMAFLELNALKRKEALDPAFVLALEQAKAAAKRLKKRGKLQRIAQQEALKEFRVKVRAASGGSFIRGWRHILDLDGNLALSKIELLKGCKKIAFSGDVVALWKAMDVDDDGAVHLQEVDPRMALVLASYKKWAGDQYGSCVASLQQFAAMMKRRTPKWNLEDFTAALRMASFPNLQGTPLTLTQVAAMLHEAFDLYGVGSITAQDVGFLDKWEPTPWLCADADFKEKDRFIAALRSRYTYLIVAWRRLLDRENTNRVSFKDFGVACRFLRFKNVAGIWRALDEDASGFISLREIDQGSSDALLDFKEWAESTFGTIQRAFKVLDTNRTNSLSFPVFKRALKDFGFEGDPRLLFQSLKPDLCAGSRSSGHEQRLTLADLRYMSSWESDCQDDISECSGDPSGDDSANASSKPQPPSAATALAQDVPERRAATAKSQLSPMQLPRTPATPSATRFSESRKVMYPRKSDQFWFCRSQSEFEAFTSSRTMASAGTMARTKFTLHDLLLPRVTDDPGKDSSPVQSPFKTTTAMWSSSHRVGTKPALVSTMRTGSTFAGTMTSSGASRAWLTSTVREGRGWRGKQLVNTLSLPALGQDALGQEERALQRLALSPPISPPQSPPSVSPGHPVLPTV